ncbi:UNVERIFIED_CONTAM: hypothetical protein K2H54_063230 [Gekko kuhli]
MVSAGCMWPTGHSLRTPDVDTSEHCIFPRIIVSQGGNIAEMIKSRFSGLLSRTYTSNKTCVLCSPKWGIDLNSDPNRDLTILDSLPAMMVLRSSGSRLMCV